MQGKKFIKTATAPAAIGPYSQAIEMDGWLFLSGQIPIDPKTGQTIEGGIAEQTTRVLENISAILREGTCTMQHVVKTTVYLSDLNEFAPMNEVYARYFHEPFPARATVQVAALPRGVKVEIDAVARRPF